MKKIIIVFTLIFNTLLVLGVDSKIDNGFTNSNGNFSEGITSFPPDFNFQDGEIPMIPIVPALPTTGKDIDEFGQTRLLEKTFTVMLESKVNVFVPLEVITDIDIESNVVGDQVIDIPFEIELNRKPEKKDYYTLKYSESIIDIDRDGAHDTYIFSPTFINEKVSKDNFVRVYGENITKEGTHKKDIYITIEIGE